MATKKTSKTAAESVGKKDTEEKLTHYHKTFADDPDDTFLQCPECQQVVKPGVFKTECAACKVPPIVKCVNKSMFDMVDDHLQVDSYSKVVREIAAIFNVATRTVDRCIHEVHAMWQEAVNETRTKRKGRYVRRKETLYKMAVRKGDVRTADAVLMGLVEIQGDKKPDLHLLMGGDKDPAALLKQADDMRKLAEEME